MTFVNTPTIGAVDSHQLLGLYHAEIVQVPLAQITWYHNIALLEKLTSDEERL